MAIKKPFHCHLPRSDLNPVASVMHRFVPVCPSCFGLISVHAPEPGSFVSRRCGATDPHLCHGNFIIIHVTHTYRAPFQIQLLPRCTDSFRCAPVSALSITCTRARFIVSRGTTDSCLCQDKTFNSFHCYVLHSDSNPVASRMHRLLPVCTNVLCCLISRHAPESGSLSVAAAAQPSQASVMARCFINFMIKGKHFSHFIINTAPRFRILGIRKPSIHPGKPQWSWPRSCHATQFDS
ncbi:hypothetical protein AB205_0093490 [Aquarana catesbeiana]|uniref:Uncharacterized protein n=1 Tax=Aquarana catesbeiana TaxID=8400 RepID=A0A2G9RY72_AQUCT|nr:hypothetical protein AB205_0093490 [Aquarana catesbeiana]